MSGHTSRSRSPSTGPPGRHHSPSLGRMSSQGIDPQMFNSSVYQAGAAFPQQSQFLNANQMNPNYSMADMSQHDQALDLPGAGQNYEGFVDPFQPKEGMDMNGGLMVDPSLQPGSGSINPTDLMGNMSSRNAASPTSGMTLGMSDQHHSPSMQQNAYGNQSPSHSRHVSLDPSSAFVQDSSGQWMGHRRSPSDQSDVSSASHSPYQTHAEFEKFEPNHSPHMPASNDASLFQEGIDMNRFTISDGQHRASLSQHNSPYVSPNLVPVHINNGLGPEGHFVLPSNGMQFDNGVMPNDMGQADTMAPPAINVEYAPQPYTQLPPGEEPNVDALSPPQRGRTIRNRAKSDTSLGPGPMMSRPLSPSDLTPNIMAQPSMLEASLNQPQRHRSLSPFDATFPANYRSASAGGSTRSSRRSSTSSINPNRDYILELADPTRPGASGSGHAGTRVQKHPANFQCHVCPKRFTRAYNLRSHLRTHTDERPFVCSVCHKAFARQHDRKRHEGLHSGEKKFVCKGDLAGGQGHWGCGRRFARADALGRHFRSEAGRVCIKPLLDEEQAEKRRAYEQSVLTGAGAAGYPMGQMPPAGGMPPPPGVLPSQGPGVDLSMPPSGPFALPQAILAQYPALQGLQWDQLGNGPVSGGEDDGGMSGTGSYDASGDVYDDDDDYLSGPGTGYAQPQMHGGWVGE